MSPSMRREWIEIISRKPLQKSMKSPSMRREWIEISDTLKRYKTIKGLPPCGGSGLKLNSGFYA